MYLTSIEMASKHKWCRDYILDGKVDANTRQKEIDGFLEETFKEFISEIPTKIIHLKAIDQDRLADMLLMKPAILKSLCISANVAKRAFWKDLGININMYHPRLSPAIARKVAEYLKPILPDEIALDTLSYLDRIEYVDKTVRAAKGNWEKQIVSELSKQGPGKFKKRQFLSNGEKYELDAAYPAKGDDPILIGVDVKQISSPMDIHKRSDEIINRAKHLKAEYPDSFFAAVVHYPYDEKLDHLKSRLSESNIDVCKFCTEDEQSIVGAVKDIIAKWKQKAK